MKIVDPHGGVTSTSFNERSAQDSAHDASLADCDAFIKSTAEAFANMSAARKISSDDVAQVIYRAATDGSDQLRYLIGDNSRGFIRARRETSEQEYVTLMRARFPAAP